MSGGPLGDFLSARSRGVRPSPSSNLLLSTVRQDTNYTMSAFKKLIPLFDRVLVQRMAAETKTKGGVLLPEKSQNKVAAATVVAVGPGARSESGSVIAPSVQVGDNVLLPEFGGTKVALEDKEFYLFRDGDILGKLE